MPISATAFHRPATLAEACELGRRLGRTGAFLAGGTELIPDYLRGRESALELIALDRVEDLRGIRTGDGWLHLGALTTIAQLARAPEVHHWLPALALAARALASPPIRSLATIGGNFCRAVPCADTPPVVVAAGGRVRLRGPEGERDMAAEAFFTGPRQTVLVPGELLVEVLVPAQPAESGTSYQRFARRRGAALAVAAVAARLTLAGGRISQARLVLGAVAPVPLLVPRAAELLVGEPPGAAVFEAAAQCCAAEARPISDLRGTAGFRRELVRVLARRALEEAARQAGGGHG